MTPKEQVLQYQYQIKCCSDSLDRLARERIHAMRIAENARIRLDQFSKDAEKLVTRLLERITQILKENEELRRARDGSV